MNQQFVVRNDFFSKPFTKLVEFYFGSSVKRNIYFFHPYRFIICFSVREKFFIIHASIMTARVVYAILKRSPIIQRGLEIEVEVTAATTRRIYLFKKKEQKCLYEHKSLAKRQNFAIVSHEESSDNNFLTSL